MFNESTYRDDFTVLGKCCLCQSENLLNVISLSSSPPANELVSKPIKQQKFPLNVNQCQQCGHHQLDGEVNPSKVFSDYKYVAGTSSINRKHFQDYANLVSQKCNLQKSSFIFEIGSNDGTMLQFFKEKEFNVLGIDPARQISEAANKNGIKTINDFFSRSQAEKIVETYGKADAIIANNVLAHTAQLQDIVDGIKILLNENGTLIFEVSYFLNVLDKTLFDLIYNEHIHQHLIGPLYIFFIRNDMFLYDVDLIPNHGGSIRCYVKKQDIDDNIAKLNDLMLQENNINHKIKQFNHDIIKLGNQVFNKLKDIKSQGNTIAAYGYPAKATTMFHQFNIGQFIDFIVDDNPLKQNMLSPGCHIPIYHSNEITNRKPDYILVSAWNFAQDILNKNSHFQGQWIIPLPELFCGTYQNYCKDSHD